MTYTLDTNILIGLVQRYPRDIFPAMWSNIESSVHAGDSCICEAILREVHRGGDELHEWAKGLPGFVCPATDEELELVAEIAVAHPGWVQGQLNEADPFVVAHAKAEQSTIVTEESRKGPNTLDKNQKIPNIADGHGVETVKFFDYVRENGWRF
ncbi:DUF4411 family protein [Bogoriella caseilytica]|uniref:Uncharacterized protein DUF4411 n=1 Tax=Bogoriella caseilytica TaxID=56055 RepID=A0A3N2BDU3_9MICO|nr:DUF4411 family protein [Bogoriella caseilytica]ROR73412.1 uncharacterized protein DUF4411 [Bogoriella caseilytica]